MDGSLSSNNGDDEPNPKSESESESSDILIDSDSDILCQREMNEWNFLACGTKVGGNLRWNFDGISYVNFRGEEPNPNSMYIPWYLASRFYGTSGGSPVPPPLTCFHPLLFPIQC